MEISPGFHNTFVEVLVNARDRNFEDPNSNEYRVTINQDKNEITIRNNGNGVNTGNTELDLGEGNKKTVPNP